MDDRIFLPGDILIPRQADMELWSVVACDQFTSEPEYWYEAERMVGEAPSTLKMMLPEAFFGIRDTEKETEKLLGVMENYLKNGVFRTVEQSYIYTERTLSTGGVRRGLLGLLDLEAYDYHRGSVTPVHSTEGVVEDRLPPRLAVRRRAALEMPHVMVFIDDPDHWVIDPIVYTLSRPEKLYDFQLMQGGGRLTGWQVSGEKARCVSRALARLADPQVLLEKYGEGSPRTIFAVGDGNHSLAAAKLYWEQLRETLSDEERLCHPARWAMAELVNIHDSSVVFEPIHRVLFETGPAGFVEAAKAALCGGETAWDVTVIAGGRRERISASAGSMAELIAKCEAFCRSYIEQNGGRLDYIHGDDTAADMAKASGCAGLLLPAMKKGELFPSIIKSGGFPRKSFSVGHARDKRYYLECREIR